MNRMEKLLKLISKGPERLEKFSEQLFQEMVERVVVTLENKVTFYLKGGFRFEERIEG